MEGKEQDNRAGRLAWVFVGAMPAFVLGGAVMFAFLWSGPVAVRDSVIAQYEADAMRAAAYLDVAPSEAPRIGVLDGLNSRERRDGGPIVLTEKASGCEYIGEIKETISGDSLVAILERERCGDLLRVVRFMAVLGPKDGEPLRKGEEFRIYNQPQQLPSGVAVPDPALLKDVLLDPLREKLGQIEAE